MHIFGDDVKEALLMRRVWCLLFPGRMVPCIRVFEDNIVCASQSASSAVSTLSSKHIDRGRQFLREVVTKTEIVAIRVKSGYQHADFSLLNHGVTTNFRFHRDIVTKMD